MVVDANRILAFRTSALHLVPPPRSYKDRIFHDPGGATGGRSLVVRFPVITYGALPSKPGMRVCGCARDIWKGNHVEPWLRRIRTGRGVSRPRVRAIASAILMPFGEASIHNMGWSHRGTRAGSSGAVWPTQATHHSQPPRYTMGMKWLQPPGNCRSLLTRLKWMADSEPNSQPETAPGQVGQN